MIYVLIGLFMFMWSLFIYHVVLDKRLEGFFAKGFTSFMFIVIFIYGVYSFLTKRQETFYVLLFEYKYVYLILFTLLGLVSGLIGDLFLEVQWFYKKRKHFMIFQGMIIFLIGHLFYMLAMTLFSGFHYSALLVGFAMVIIVYVGSKLLDIDFKRLKLMTYIYTFIIFTMVGLSFYQAIHQGFSLYSVVFLIGAVCFGISDLFLAPIYFKDETKHFFVVGNLFTYYLGQFLIALAILFI